MLHVIDPDELPLLYGVWPDFLTVLLDPDPVRLVFEGLSRAVLAFDREVVLIR
jgi:uncharacterized membrane protein